MMREIFLLLLFCYLIESSTSGNTNIDYLQRGSSLSVDDSSNVIRSSDSSYTCGFYGFESNAYWFAIWFTNSKERTVVWTANRNTPVNGRGSKLTFRRNGAMVLTDVDGMVVWETNTTSTDVNRAELLNTEISSVYWPSPDPGFNVWKFGRTSYNSSRTAVLNDLGEFNSSDWWHFTASDMGFGIKRRLTMDHDGNLRIYSLNESTGLWLISWQAITQPCNIHGICGRNGICVHGIPPECSCPPGHEWNDPTDFSEGCEGFCFTKSALFNGYRYPTFPGTIYLKVPISMERTDSALILANSKATCPEVTVMVGSPSMYESSGKKVRWVYPFSFVIGIGVVEGLVILLGWWLFFKKNALLTNLEEGYRMISSQFRSFTYQELVKATRNFKVEIGRGGSGTVYKGFLEDERVVAVKRLGDVSDGGEFWAEVSTIGKINHMNLVRMWGLCSQKQHRLIVYEYVENLSLDQRLFSSSFLQWKERFKVAIGIAKGLAYLHHECLEWVIHCDVKPENILLDGSFEPKIADFGLAKLSQRGSQGSEFTRIRGTKGYMAPEWASNLPITAKVDVYSYGVVVLEMARGIRLSNIVVQEGEAEESELIRFVKHRELDREVAH
ncbi:hypothetical protein L2E82_21031 [Cichorium intybus]|uniref:Uncharacterized protein n=1 Tax=Cichorium intybus TaxID=13427 RepID=A0ACB9DVB4_CICIN|nr:hypothetical protein L2E82_21031 [Cichorium intybus]